MNQIGIEPNNDKSVDLERSRVYVQLLPLVLTAIVASTAVSVDVSRPILGPLLWRAGQGDFLLNVFLYVPLGVMLSRHGVVRCGLAGAALSMTIETIQLFFPDRFTSASDVVANTAGTILGCAAYTVTGLHARWKSGLFENTRGIGVFTLVVCVLFIGLISFPRRPSDFRNWDPACRLSLGDDLTGDRPWEGDMTRVMILPLHLDSKAIQRLTLTNGWVPPEVEEQALFAQRFSGDFDRVRGKSMLTPRETKRFFDAFTGNSTLTILVWVRAANVVQGGPARLVSYATSIWKQNFMLGQEGKNIVFRVLTPTSGPGGFTPQLETHGVLTAGRDALIAATYDGRSSRVYLDGQMIQRLNLRARGRNWPFLADSGLPASAVFIGVTMALGVIGATRGGWRRRRRLIGAFSGLAGGIVFVAAGGVDALPGFTPWVLALAMGGGVVVGYSARLSTHPPTGPAASPPPAPRSGLGHRCGASD